MRTQSDAGSRSTGRVLSALIYVGHQIRAHERTFPFPKLADDRSHCFR